MGQFVGEHCGPLAPRGGPGAARPCRRATSPGFPTGASGIRPPRRALRRPARASATAGLPRAATGRASATFRPLVWRTSKTGTSMKLVAHPGRRGCEHQDRLLALLHLPPDRLPLQSGHDVGRGGALQADQKLVEKRVPPEDRHGPERLSKPFVLGLRVDCPSEPLEVLLHASADVGGLAHRLMLPAPRTRRSAIAHRPGAAAGKPGLGR